METDHTLDDRGVLSFAKSPGMYLTTMFLTYVGLYTLLGDVSVLFGSTKGHFPPMFLYSLCVFATLLQYGRLSRNRIWYAIA
jgi:hypothetical protein